MTPWIVAALAGVVAAVAILLVVAQRSEIRFLRSQLAVKHDHQRRIERAEAGLPEVKVDPEPPDIAPPGLQVRIDKAIGAWESSVTQEQLRQDVRQWRRDGREWSWIANELESELV